MKETRFDALKAEHRARYGKAKGEGKVDPRMVALIEFLFSKEDYYTTTTCSGRIVLLQLNEQEEKREGNFFAKWHEAPSADEVWAALQKPSAENIWFKQESFVMVVGCRTESAAKKIMSIARNHGVKKCGLMSFSKGKYLVEIWGSHYMSFLAKREGKLLCDRAFFDAQLVVAAQKLARNHGMLEAFEAHLRREA